MTITSITVSSWDYEYLPYTMADKDDLSTDIEIPNYRIFPSESPEDYIAETNEHLPGDMQEKHALLLSAAPDLYEALNRFFNVMHYDCERSVREGYLKVALAHARVAISKAKGETI